MLLCSCGFTNKMMYRGYQLICFYHYRIIAVFVTLCSLEAKVRTIVEQNNRLIKLLEKKNR